MGAFVTHYGWNSTLSAGLPVSGEQLYNEKLVIEVSRTGVAIRSVQWKRIDSEGVKKRREAITEAIKKVMVGEEAEGLRSRAKAYKNIARQAVEEGRSSYTGLTNLLQDISA